MSAIHAQHTASRKGKRRERVRTGSTRPTSRNSSTVFRPRARSRFSRSRARSSSKSRRDRAKRSSCFAMDELRNDWKKDAMVSVSGCCRWGCRKQARSRGGRRRRGCEEAVGAVGAVTRDWKVMPRGDGRERGRGRSFRFSVRSSGCRAAKWTRRGFVPVVV